MRRGGTKSQTPQEVQGHPGLRAVGGGRIEANYLAGSLEVGEIGVFQVGQRGGNGKGEDLTRLEGSGWIYMEIRAAQANIPGHALTLERGVGLGQTGMKGHGEGDHNPFKLPSFQGGDHEPAFKER
jgi:hypothetical protein